MPSYEIRIEGHLAAYRLRHFERVTIRQEADGTTVILGPFRGQSALFGLLNWLHSLGIPLVSVQRLGEPGVAEGRGEG
jgi:hypothetical protein